MNLESYRTKEKKRRRKKIIKSEFGELQKAKTERKKGGTRRKEEKSIKHELGK